EGIGADLSREAPVGWHWRPASVQHRRHFFVRRSRYNWRPHHSPRNTRMAKKKAAANKKTVAAKKAIPEKKAAAAKKPVVEKKLVAEGKPMPEKTAALDRDFMDLLRGANSLEAAPPKSSTIDSSIIGLFETALNSIKDAKFRLAQGKDVTKE